MVFLHLGGGLILVPAYIYILKIDEKTSRATALFSILPMVMVAGIFYSKANFINWKIGIYCAIGGIIGALIGTRLLKKLSNKYLKIIFIIFLIYMSFKLLRT